LKPRVFDSPNAAHIRDIAYGPLDVRNLRKDPKTENDAVHNADSYMWFALVKNSFPSSCRLVKIFSQTWLKGKFSADASWVL
ncbi:MAG: hypothetical protein Q9211_005065, partial [Gyalolechia sp. 1 TL-2023]